MKIYRIETGKVRIKQNQLKKSNGITPKMTKVLFDNQWSDWLPIYAWIIEHKEGLFVVDTGETHKTGKNGYLPKWHPYYALAVDFDVKPEDEIGPKMKNLGINPSKDVKQVIMTHLHTDHAGGLYHFQGIEILIEKNEYKAASGMTGIFAGYLPQRWPNWLNPKLITLPEEKYGPFHKSMSLTKDDKIKIIATPGHVANHISVVSEIDDLFYFIAGDTSYTQENMLKTIPDGVGTNESVDTLKRIKSFSEKHPTIYLPSHDPEVPVRIKNKQIVPVSDEQLELVS